MKNSVYLLLIMSALSFGQSKSKAANVIVNEEASQENLEVYDFDEIEKFLNLDDQKVHVVNFWATWCAPCVKELPYFEALQEKYKDQNVEVLLISLDFPNQYESKLKPFIQKKNIKSKVIALNDTDMNTWLPKVDESWSGAIPATIIYTKEKKQFYEQSFTYEELESQVQTFLK
ncbi:MAG TPA: redoxin domain-containing protein [Mangrovimonas sp.]|nr:redoxin domain-containing protein [Mangrovimonas sp.]